jgi:hypothetical protein
MNNNADSNKRSFAAAMERVETKKENWELEKELEGKAGAKSSDKNKKKTGYAEFVAGTDYGIRRTTTKEWYIRTTIQRGKRKGKVEWVKADKQEVKNHLFSVHDLTDAAPKGLTSDADDAMLDALSYCVEGAGAYAGYREAGEIPVEDGTILITRGIDLLELAPGECEFCRNAFTKPFPASHTELLTIDADGNIVRDSDGNTVPYATLAVANDERIEAMGLTRAGSD